jgi:hypothetical protein
MSYIFCDACGAGFHSDVLSCPECGAPARLVRSGRARSSAGHERLVGEDEPSVGEDVELEVRDTLYGRRSGTVQRVSGL